MANHYTQALRRFDEEEPSGSNRDRWLLTYADMITLLAAFFLMLYSMSVVSKGKFSVLAQSMKSGFNGGLNTGEGIEETPRMKIERAQYQEALKNLVQFVEQNRMSGKVALRPEERGLVISLVSDNMLFKRGQAEVQQDSEKLMDQVTQILKSAPRNQVQIEGHTDDLPIRTLQFPSNWELSASRASAMLRNFVDRHGLPANRFIASGYADTHPLAPNTNEQSRARNRRVEIILLKSEAQRAADLIRKTEQQQKQRRDRLPSPEVD